MTAPDPREAATQHSVIHLTRHNRRIDRVTLPTAVADQLEAWFHDPQMRDVPANITPPGGVAQVLHRSDYRSFSRRAAS